MGAPKSRAARELALDPPRPPRSTPRAVPRGIESRVVDIAVGGDRPSRSHPGTDFPRWHASKTYNKVPTSAASTAPASRPSRPSRGSESKP